LLVGLDDESGTGREADVAGVEHGSDDGIGVDVDAWTLKPSAR
jgi:hypothetical protein